MKDGHKANEQLLYEWVEVHPGVLVLQLNGKRGSQSIEQLEDLLSERCERRDSSAALVDATGVDNIDAGIAQHLTDIISALRLPVTRVFLATGDSSIDRKLTHFGVNLSNITICHSLAAGLWMALDIVESSTANPLS